MADAGARAGAYAPASGRERGLLAAMARLIASFRGSAPDLRHHRPASSAAFTGTYRALEQRIVFDGAAVATLAAAEHHTDADPGATHDDAGGMAALADNLAAHVAITSGEAQGATAAAGHEIAFIDTGVADLGALVAGLDPKVEVVLIDSTKDGVSQMAEALNGRHDISAIHIFSHGSEAELSFGTARLDVASMQGQYAEPSPPLAARSPRAPTSWSTAATSARAPMGNRPSISCRR